MAQAARQSLRMQKELKLLLTDPPPGASFPFLSPLSDSSSPSLSSIDADIEGPEGTVYEKGVFRLKIQIPERYPFQPPIVTFATPIYHPNIDNGGRICLDILNLPPKGAWQPSLNISTVLTSIGLLLSEPNPDDGLMCEASKEYKYNRHAFDQKARSMTEKFARAGNGDGSCSKNSQAQSSTSTVEMKVLDVSNCEIDEDLVSNTKFNGNVSKLSLEGTTLQQNKDLINGVNEKTIDKIEKPKEACRQTLEENHQNYKILSLNKRKLSLGSLGPEQKVDDEKETLKKEQNLHYNKRLPNRDGDLTTTHSSNKTENYLNISKRKKLGLASKRLSLGISSSSQAQQIDNKENTNPAQSLPLSYTTSLQLNKNRDDLAINNSKNMGEKYNSRIEDEPIGKLQGGDSGKQVEREGSILPDSVIVLDSEDSEEEEERKGYTRSRLSVTRKRLLGKSKSNIRC